MCECRPDADILAEFEPALFQRYDLSVEFFRRRRLVTHLLGERWLGLDMMTDAEIVRQLVCVCSIEPLRLDREHERLVVEHVGVVAETGQPCRLYRRFIPFSGDAELWQLAPGDYVDPRATGEVAYLEYVTAVLETTKRAALEILNERSKVIEGTIAAQRDRIAAFNNGLAAFIAREVAKWRQCGELLRWRERPTGGG